MAQQGTAMPSEGGSPDGKAVTPAAPAPFKTFALTSEDKAYALQFRFTLQAQARYFPDDEREARADAFLLRRVRPVLEGTLARDFSFRIMPDFGQGGALVQDAYVDWRIHSALRLRLGKVIVPLGLERMQSSNALVLVEYSQASSLMPLRDVGLQVHGAVWQDAIGYQLGVYDGAVDSGNLDVDTDDHKDFYARLIARPLKRFASASVQDLIVGVAGSSGVHRGTAKAPGLPTYRTPGQQQLFAFNTDANAAAGVVVADGYVRRIAPQAALYVGPASFMGEYAVASERVQVQGAVRRMVHHAWQATATVMLTGDQARYEGVRVAHPVNAGGIGAFELMLRVDELRLDPDAIGFATERSFTRCRAAWGGVSWRPVDELRFTGMYVYSALSRGATLHPKDHENTVLAQAQVGF